MQIQHELVYRRAQKEKTAEDDVVDVNNQQSRNVLTDAFNGLNILQENEVMVESAERRNNFNLAPGEFAGPILKKMDSTIWSVAAGSTINTKLALNSRHVVDGVRFTSSVDNRGTLVQMSATSVVVFRSCVFHRTVSAPVPNWVAVADGGKAVFLGCMFLGDGTGGAIILSPGAAANVQVVGCYNGTGIAFAGVTSAALGNI